MKIGLYKCYVIRNHKLIEIEKHELFINEIFCYTTTTPSTPADCELNLISNNAEKDNLKSVINMDYFNEQSVTDFINGVGEFKNWWE
jgi:hypothetical protein